MKTVQIEFSKYESVNFLWPELIEDYGFDKAKKIISQAIDLQKMNGTKNSTMPIIFSGTGGLALVPIKMLERENFNPFISLGGDNQKVNHMAEAALEMNLTCNDLKKDLNLTDGDVVDMLQLVMDRFKNNN